ncbi:MAG: hypothetical protein A2Y17_10915 [Clostridiales bacterium GWF2_38_85]|nr:MAG: hypothetical protein A2Y17_10915 [Clostridiales bacterium GWF2_38_85]
MEATLANGAKIILRLEQPEDYHEVELLIRAAFWKAENKKKLNGIGCDEHYLTHTLRTAPEFIQELDFVAVHGNKIVGNVMYSVAYVQKPDRTKHPVINFGPLSVLPEYQKTGVGSALMRHTLRVADLMGYGAVLFFGHPEYYPRFGFKEAKEFGITTAWGANFPAFMAMELIHGSLSGVTGSFYESPLFNVDNEKAREFDRMIFCRG